MPKLVILGSSYAIPDKDQDNTYMVIVGKENTVLIDCASNPILRLQQAGVDLNSITDLILTHFHPDHVSGVPLFLMSMWIMGRRKPLKIHGLPHTVDRIETMMNLYQWEEWPNLFPVVFFRLPNDELTPVLENGEFRIVASPVKHLIPTMGLRVEFTKAKKTLVYSCDTEPCNTVINLAKGADVLVHEAAGAVFGHSSAAQAGDIAQNAKVQRLYLIHYPDGKHISGNPIAEAQDRFSGPVHLAEDFMELDF